MCCKKSLTKQLKCTYPKGLSMARRLGGRRHSMSEVRRQLAPSSTKDQEILADVLSMAFQRHWLLIISGDEEVLDSLALDVDAEANIIRASRQLRWLLLPTWQSVFYLYLKAEDRRIGRKYLAMGSLCVRAGSQAYQRWRIWEEEYGKDDTEFMIQSPKRDQWLGGYCALVYDIGLCWSVITEPRQAPRRCIHPSSFLSDQRQACRDLAKSIALNLTYRTLSTFKSASRTQLLSMKSSKVYLCKKKTGKEGDG